MVTKLYLRAATNSASNLPTTKQSSLTNDLISTDALSLNRTLSVSKGTNATQTQLLFTSPADTSTHTVYFSRFVSAPIGQTSVAANTWTYAADWSTVSSSDLSFPSTAGSAGIKLCCYVWRPSTQAVVGFILDGTSANRSNTGWGGEAGVVVTFAGSAVPSCQVGDVIIFEVWSQYTQTAATAWSKGVNFDSTVDPSDGSLNSSSNADAYISTPETITWQTTKIYFHATTPPTYGGSYPTTKQSSLTNNGLVDALTVNRYMNTTISTTAQTSLALTSNATVSAQNYYFTRFVSDPLNQSSISANTWTYAFAAKQSSTSANFPSAASSAVRVTAYVWRPTTSTIIGTILDGNSTNRNALSDVAQDGYVVTFTGSSVSSMLAGDVIIFEVWFQITQGSATAFTDTFYYDGASEPVDGGIETSSASYISTPQTLVWQALPAPTKIYWHAATSGVSGTLPATTQSSLTSSKVADAVTVNRSMDKNIGTTQTSIVLASNATVSSQNYYFTKFVSAPIYQTSVAANTWTVSFAYTESNTSANFPVTASNKAVRATLYVWRPSTGANIATIIDGTTGATISESAASTEKTGSATFAGASASIASGDVLVWEVWFVIVQGSATSYNDTLYFDGTTEASATSSASFISTPEQLAWTAVVNIPQTVYIEWEES